MKNYDQLQFDCNKFADSDEFELYLRTAYPNFLGKRVQVAVQKGWWPFILHLAQFLREKDLEKDVQISQIKEKFGYLRIYADPITTKKSIKMVYDKIVELERFSGSYCERCGSREHVSTDTKPNGYWVKTYCDACFKDSSNGR